MWRWLCRWGTSSFENKSFERKNCRNGKDERQGEREVWLSSNENQLKVEANEWGFGWVKSEKTKHRVRISQINYVYLKKDDH